MKSIRAIATAALAACSLLFAAQASAQLYIGASGGASEIQNSLVLGPLITSGTVDNKDAGFKVFGGYLFNEYLGVEYSYMDLGTMTYSGDFLGTPVTGGKVEVKGNNFSLVVMLPLSESFSLMGKVGMFQARVKATDTTGGAPFSFSDRKTADSAALGVNYNLGKHISLRAEAERLKIDINDSVAYFYSAGIAFKF